MKRAEKFAHPALAVFLQRVARGGRWTPLALLSAWPEKVPRPQENTIYKWLQQPTRLTHANAEILIQIMDCRAALERSVSLGTFADQRANVFDYDCRNHGIVSEWDLAACLQNGLSPEVLASQLIRIDFDLFADQNQSEWVGEITDWRDMLIKHPDTWRVFVCRTSDGWDVLGYWMFVTPTDDWFARACIGEYPETRLVVSTTKAINDGQINLYGPGLYCRRDVTGYSRDILGSRLLLSFLYQFERLRRLGVAFDRVCIPVMSEEGRRLTEDRFGLERLPESISDRYAASMNWPRSRIAGRLLPALYFGDLSPEMMIAGGLDV